MLRPGDDCVEDGGGSVDGGEFVVAGGQAAPLFEVAEPAFDEVALSVVDGVEGWRSPASCAAAFAVPDLIVGLGDDCGDASFAQMSADRARGVGLVAAQPVRAGAWTPYPASDP